MINRPAIGGTHKGDLEVGVKGIPRSPPRKRANREELK